VHGADDPVDVVQRLGGPDLPGQLGQCGGDETDLPVLVLDVDLERVQAMAHEGDVLVDPPSGPGQCHRHVDPADFARIRTRQRRFVDPGPGL
jgi:hypothetical protein